SDGVCVGPGLRCGDAGGVGTVAGRGMCGGGGSGDAAVAGGLCGGAGTGESEWVVAGGGAVPSMCGKVEQSVCGAAVCDEGWGCADGGGDGACAAHGTAGAFVERVRTNGDSGVCQHV